MSGGTWIPTSLPIRPGVYINFVEAAAAAITGGERGVVALGLSTYSGTATVGKYYEVETLAAADTLFGAANTLPISFALQGGASSVIVYTLPASPVAGDYTAMRAGFDTQFFNVFVAQVYNVTEQAALKTWLTTNRTDGKQFMLVIGGDATTDADPTVGNTRSTLNADNAIVNVINGAIVNGVSYTSSAYAPFIGRLQNNADGRAALIASVTKYLETLEDNGVLEAPIVTLDPNNPPVGDKVFLAVSYVEIDSMERIFFTINV
jgi:hypothetical protein